MTDANLDAGGNNGQGGDAPAWAAQLEGDLQTNERLTSFQNISEMGKALIATEGRLGEADTRLKDALFVPGEGATDEDRAAFHTRLGRPETAEKYEFAKPAEIPGITNDETVEAGFKQLAFDKGLPQQTAAELHQWYWDTVKAGHEQQKQATQEALDTLKGEWKGDAFKTNSELAVRAFTALSGGIDGADKFLSETIVDGIKLGDHPMFARIFHSAATKISDDSMAGDRGGNQVAAVSDEAQAQKRFPNTKFKEA